MKKGHFRTIESVRGIRRSPGRKAELSALDNRCTVAHLVLDKVAKAEKVRAYQAMPFLRPTKAPPRGFHRHRSQEASPNWMPPCTNICFLPRYHVGFFLRPEIATRGAGVTPILRGWVPAGPAPPHPRWLKKKPHNHDGLSWTFGGGGGKGVAASPWFPARYFLWPSEAGLHFSGGGASKQCGSTAPQPYMIRPCRSISS